MCSVDRRNTANLQKKKAFCRACTRGKKEREVLRKENVKLEL